VIKISKENKVDLRTAGYKMAFDNIYLTEKVKGAIL